MPPPIHDPKAMTHEEVSARDVVAVEDVWAAARSSDRRAGAWKRKAADVQLEYRHAESLTPPESAVGKGAEEKLIEAVAYLLKAHHVKARQAFFTATPDFARRALMELPRHRDLMKEVRLFFPLVWSTPPRRLLLPVRIPREEQVGTVATRAASTKALQWGMVWAEPDRRAAWAIPAQIDVDPGE